MGQVGGRRLFRVTVPVVLAALVGLSVGTGAGMSLALQTAVMGVGGNTMSAAAKFDIVPPNIAGSVIAKSTGTGQYLSGSISRAAPSSSTRTSRTRGPPRAASRR